MGRRGSRQSMYRSASVDLYLSLTKSWQRHYSLRRHRPSGNQNRVQDAL